MEKESGRGGKDSKVSQTAKLRQLRHALAVRIQRHGEGSTLRVQKLLSPPHKGSIVDINELRPM